MFAWLNLIMRDNGVEATHSVNAAVSIAVGVKTNETAVKIRLCFLSLQGELSWQRASLVHSFEFRLQYPYARCAGALLQSWQKADRGRSIRGLWSVTYILSSRPYEILSQKEFLFVFKGNMCCFQWIQTNAHLISIWFNINERNLKVISASLQYGHRN